MPVEIPFFDIASFSEEVILEGLPYVFKFTYNDTNEFWSLGVYTRDEVAIVSGLKLVLDYDLFDQFPGRGLPPGSLFAVDTTDSRVKIDRTNILDIIKLLYYTEDEVAAV